MSGSLNMSNLAVNLSMIFTEVPLIERFALAHAHGFQHVEIQFPYELEIIDIKNQLEQYNLSLCLINVPAGDLMQGGNGLAGIPGKEVEFINRLTYPNSEISVNSENVQAAISTQGPDNLATKVWWAK